MAWPAWAALRKTLLASACILACGFAPSQEIPCVQGLAPQRCASCHREDAAARFEKDRLQPCAPFCLTCHPPAEMEKHHTIGRTLERPLHRELRLDAKERMTCATCHHLGRTRFDTRRWRSESLFDRMFRRQDRYRTYLLVFRNDRGQLCKACH